MSKSEQEKQEDRKVNRQKIFQNALLDYETAKWPSKLQERILEGKSKKGIIRSDHSEGILNDAYWSLLDEFVRPHVKYDPDSPSRVQLFKILSATELAVAHKAIFAVNGLTDKLTPDERKFELILNAHFGFFCALAILAGWKEQPEKDSKGESQKKQRENNFREIMKEHGQHFAEMNELSETRYDKHPINIIEEHVRLIAFAIQSSEVVAMTNATWWRMFCLYVRDKTEPYPIPDDSGEERGAASGLSSNI